ncbi:hypothetical protein AK812_SmicGene43233 [Symbiodinium microadriaticum]|uniref:Uncharacterized protein n=1 Tax=Symbiodinium microadriaticum TaxID=2951 RepID=A0A1Q9C1J5_SYMMI|nr:hypothetical protein AK812_SmicGene43233 [Symbiodinium microadriaticum]
MPRAQKHKTAQDVELTDVDSDSDVDLQPVRLPSGLPLDDLPPQISANSHLEVEQVCRRHLDNGYIPMSVFSWLAQTLPSELLRASALIRYNQPGSVNVLVKFYRWVNKSTCGRVGYDAKTSAIVSLACDMSIQRNVDQAPEIIAYTILEVTFDLRAVVSLAQTNKTTWIRCSQVLRAASTECKIKTNAPWHKRAGRAVDKDAPETPIDI